MASSISFTFQYSILVREPFSSSIENNYIKMILNSLGVSNILDGAQKDMLFNVGDLNPILQIETT